MGRTSRILLTLAAMVAALVPVGLGSTAYAGSCETLGPADVAYSAPRLSGTLDEATPTICYDLDVPEGTVLALALAVTDYSYPSATVRSGSDGAAETCYARRPCRLGGSGPYVLTLRRSDPPFDVTYQMQLLALTGDTGCPSVVPGALGSDEGLVSGTVPLGELDCRTVTVTSPIALNSYPGKVTARPVNWSLFGVDGQLLCTSDSEIALCPTDPGTDTLLFAPPDSLATTIAGQVADLTKTSGCRALSSSWLTDALVVDTNTVGRLDCRTLSGVASGDPVTRPSTTVSRFINANGRDACHAVDIGCVMTGPAPFEVLTASDFSVYSDVHLPTYDVAVRKVGPTSDCPVIQPVDYGAVPSDHLPGVGCRQFTAVAGHRYAVTAAIDRLNFGREEDFFRAYKSDFSSLTCMPDGAGSTHGQSAVGQCDPTSGDVTVLDTFTDYGGDIVQVDNFTTGLYDLSSDAGCAGPGVGLPGVRSILGLAVTECQLVDVPSGTRVLTAARLGSGYGPDSRYVDATGALVCTPSVQGPTSFDNGCVLSGPGPYRLLTSAFRAEYLPVSIATAPTDDLGACRTVPTGIVGTSATFQSGDPVAKCRRIPATTDPSGQVVRVAHVSGNSYTQAHLIGEDGLECDGGPEYWVLPCTHDGRTADGSGATLVLVGTPDSAEQVYRADLAGVPINWKPSSIGGRVGVGRVVTAELGDWYNPGGTYTYRWIVARHYVAGATGLTFAIPRSAAGHSLAVEVTAHNGTAKRVSRSIAVIVPKP